jgi:FKBP-type peptidyl-prolyl cis-trans isomerase FkpA
MTRLLGRTASSGGRVLVASLAMTVLGGCGTLVTISSSFTPPPPSCFTPRPVTAPDSFSAKVSVTTGAEGLQLGDIRVGCGAVAKNGSVVTLEFTAWLASGMEVGTSRSAGQPPVSFTLGNTQVSPPFWNLGVPGIRVGGLRRLVVPPALAFGAQGNPNAGVPPNTTLVIDVELLNLQSG